MRIQVAVPSHDNLPALFAYDLAKMMAYVGVNYVGPTEPIKELGLTFSAGTYVHTARNQLAEIAMQDGADYILWLDADMRFPKDILVRLLLHKRDIVGINYSNRGVPPGFVAIKRISPAERLVTGPDSTGLEEVDAIGFGAVLMRTRVLRKIRETHDGPFFWFDRNETGGLVGEDVYFCNLARKAGFEVLVDHDLSKECGHVGQLEYKLDHALAMLESE